MRGWVSRTGGEPADADDSWSDAWQSTRSDGTVRRGAKALFARDGRVLLVEERRADGSQFWTLPGGGIGPDESVRGGLQRELLEEVHCRARLSHVLDVCSYRHRSVPGTVTVYLVFAADLLGEPRPNPAEGVVDYRWVRPTELPAETLAPMRRAVRGWIARTDTPVTRRSSD